MPRRGRVEPPRQSPPGGGDGEVEGAEGEGVPHPRGTGSQGHPAQVRQPNPCSVPGSSKGPQAGEADCPQSRVRGRREGESLSLTPSFGPKNAEPQIQKDRYTLGTFSPNPRPRDVRGCLLTYYKMLDGCKELRAEYEAEGMSLADRCAVACVQQEIEEAIEKAKSILRAVAKRGGQGLPPPGRLEGAL